MWLIMWACPSKVEAVLLADSVSFLSSVMLNPSRNSDSNKTSTHYKAIIQFLIANQSGNNIDLKIIKNTCKPSNLILTIHPSLIISFNILSFLYSMNAAWCSTLIVGDATLGKLEPIKWQCGTIWE